MKKFYINYSHRKIEYYIDFNNTVSALNIYFKSRELAEKLMLQYDEEFVTYLSY